MFLLAEQRNGTFQYDVSVQMIEIYNERVRDLLATEGLTKRYPFFSIYLTVKFLFHIPELLGFLNVFITLEIRNNSQNGFNVPDARLVRVSSTYDVIDLMNLGQRNRVVGATALNDRSSRSHRFDKWWLEILNTYIHILLV